jgi:predicted small secreted protein
MMKKLATVLGLLGSLALTSCENVNIGVPGEKDLKPGGVYVAYNLGCDKGCDQIQKGDLIQKLNGNTVQTAADLDGLIDGQPHKLELIAKGGEAKQVEILAKPKTNLPPLENVPPFWLVSAEALNQAPKWARRRLFGHASPSVMLVSVNGGILDGRQLYGKKRLIVFWDWADRNEEAAAVDFMQVLQKAQVDLENKNIELMFTHVQFPAARGSYGRKPPMNDTDLRAWATKHAVEHAGQKLPMLPTYRWPNATEQNAAREIGMEGSFTVFENLGESPAIVLMDERGIIRWHSEGVEEPPQGAEVRDPRQYTIIEAVKFALEKL